MHKRRPLDHKGRLISMEMRTSATPRQLWQAWADPGKLEQWFPDRAEGEAKEGSIMRYFFDRFRYSFPYDVLVADPEQQLALRGSHGERSGILEIVIGQESGETVLRLVNSGFLEGAEWDDEYDGVNSGWHMMLACLKLYLERYYGRPRVQAFHMRPAVFTHEQLMPLFTTPEGLNRWLTSAAEIHVDARPVAARPGATGRGAECRLAFRDGGALTGEVLAISRREVLLSWEEIQGALCLKAFGMGPLGRMIALHAMGWGLPSGRAPALEQSLARALDRLAEVLASNP